MIPEPLAISFFVACVPPTVSHHHKKIIKVRTRKGLVSKLGNRPELQTANHCLDLWFLRHQPTAPMRGPLVLDIELTWPWLVGDSQRKRALGRIPHDSKPDWDNAAKGIADCLERLLFIEHDSRIVDGRVRKWRGEHPGIGITIRPWQATA